MVKIKLNQLEYRYEVYQIINLFYNNIDIKFVEAEEEYEVDIKENSVFIFEGDKEWKYLFAEDGKIKEEIKKGVFHYFQDKTGKELPWGILVGIRPTKIALSLLKEGKSEEEIIEYFKQHYLASKEKAQLCIDIAKLEWQLISPEKKKVSIYIGMPFCPTRCLYCSFASNSIKGCKNLVEPYLKALQYEMESTFEFIKKKGIQIETVYFGGGTPTAVNEEEFEEVMKNIYAYFIQGQNIKEFTVECGRPDSITRNKLSTIKKYGADRISINPQTMNENTLKTIGRNHSVQEVKDIFALAREEGFQCINMDLIVGLPGEGFSEIQYTCEEILKLKPDNVTVHGMSIKRASALYEKLINEEHFESLDQHELNKMYEETMKLARSLNMEPYYMYRQKNMAGNMENVGYAVKGKEGLYNIQMIEEMQTIIANGADAVSKAVFLEENRIERFGNLKDVREYINRIEEIVQKKMEFLDMAFK